jgi:trehalose synthase
LIDTVDECADRLVELLQDSTTRAAFGVAAREHVRQNYLLPRLLRDDLRLIRDVLRSPCETR